MSVTERILTVLATVIRMEQVQPGEIYNLGAQSHVAVSFEAPEYTANSDALGSLEAVRMLGLTHKPASTRPAPVSSTAWCRRQSSPGGNHPGGLRSPSIRLSSYDRAMDFATISPNTKS